MPPEEDEEIFYEFTYSAPCSNSQIWGRIKEKKMKIEAERVVFIPDSPVSRSGKYIFSVRVEMEEGKEKSEEFLELLTDAILDFHRKEDREESA